MGGRLREEVERTVVLDHALCQVGALRVEADLAVAVVEHEAEHLVSTSAAEAAAAGQGAAGRAVAEVEGAALEERMRERQVLHLEGDAADVKVEVARVAPVPAVVLAVVPAAVALEQGAAGRVQREHVPWVGGVGYP
uniref:Uncharacterized protein n=1 Tax=Aegilops tauschii TaxID=37682 RepID=N1QPV3_AEGTA